jgi:protein TonB
MLLPRHEIVSAHETGITPQRAIALGSVGLLHALAVYALITGMTPQIVKLIPPDISVDFVDLTTPTKPDPIPTLPTLVKPTDATQIDPKMPDFTIADPNNTSLRFPPGAHTGPSSDSAAAGVSSTHSTPPYPDQARLLAHQGTVLLRLTISPNGDVVAADIARSSGFAELDAQAAAWVLAHWKYKPAIVAGVAVTSQTQAAVKFDLKLTRG